MYIYMSIYKNDFWYRLLFDGVKTGTNPSLHDMKHYVKEEVTDAFENLHTAM